MVFYNQYNKNLCAYLCINATGALVPNQSNVTLYLKFPRCLADPPDPSPHGVEERLRLLVDLLLHVVPEPPQAEPDLLKPQAQRLHVPAPGGRCCWVIG